MEKRWSHLCYYKLKAQQFGYDTKMYLLWFELIISSLRSNHLTIRPLFHSSNNFHKKKMWTHIAYVFFFLVILNRKGIETVMTQLFLVFSFFPFALLYRQKHVNNNSWTHNYTSLYTSPYRFLMRVHVFFPYKYIACAMHMYLVAFVVQLIISYKIMKNNIIK